MRTRPCGGACVHGGAGEGGGKGLGEGPGLAFGQFLWLSVSVRRSPIPSVPACSSPPVPAAGAPPSIAFHLLTARLEVPAHSLRLTPRSFPPRKGPFPPRGSVWASPMSHRIRTVPPWFCSELRLFTSPVPAPASARHRRAGPLERSSNTCVCGWSDVPPGAGCGRASDETPMHAGPVLPSGAAAGTQRVFSN